MTWYFDPEGETINSIHFTDAGGNQYGVASNVPFDGSWSDPAPEVAIVEASGWCQDHAIQGNTQLGLEGLAGVHAEDWVEGTP